MPHASGIRWNRVVGDSVGFQQGSGMQFEHWPAFLQQRIARQRAEARGMNFDFITHAAYDRVLMTLRTGIGIEQWTEAVCWVEDPLEGLLSLRESGLLLRRELG